MQAITVSSQQQQQRAIHGDQVTICPVDADLTIVETALKIANDGSHATVVADDTDILET